MFVKRARGRGFRSNFVKFSATRGKTLASLGRSDCVPPPAGVSEVRRGASFLIRPSPPVSAASDFLPGQLSCSSLGCPSLISVG
jgi:hypothetical protein